jgi:hypothetical protein
MNGVKYVEQTRKERDEKRKSTYNHHIKLAECLPSQSDHSLFDVWRDSCASFTQMDL